MNKRDREVLRRVIARRSMCDGMTEFRRAIAALIPEDFAWACSLDCETIITVKWRWTGHPRVTHFGQCRDQDPGILVSLLETIDWKEELEAAFRSVEQAEAKLLAEAQERRRLRIMGGNPVPAIEAAPVAILADPAADIPSHRTRNVDLTSRLSIPAQTNEAAPADLRAEFASRLRAIRERSQSLVLGKYTGVTMEEAGRMPGAWCLTIDRHRRPVNSIRWVPFDSFPELLEAITAEPPFTWRAVWLGGYSPVIHCPKTINALAAHLRVPTGSKIR